MSAPLQLISPEHKRLQKSILDKVKGSFPSLSIISGVLRYPQADLLKLELSNEWLPDGLSGEQIASVAGLPVEIRGSGFRAGPPPDLNPKKGPIKLLSQEEYEKYKKLSRPPRVETFYPKLKSVDPGFNRFASSDSQPPDSQPPDALRPGMLIPLAPPVPSFPPELTQQISDTTKFDSTILPPPPTPSSMLPPPNPTSSELRQTPEKPVDSGFAWMLGGAAVIGLLGMIGVAYSLTNDDENEFT